MTSIFISRDLDAHSPFYSLDKAKFRICAESLIDFSAIKTTHVPNSDWYFFYSKNGVKFFYSNFGKDYFQKSKTKIKVACMGYGTRDEFHKYYDYQISFTGSGKPSNVAKEFLKTIKPNDKIAFFTADDSLHSVGKQLPVYIHQNQIKIYKNQPKEEIDIPSSDILVFTSPKNVEVYYAHYDINSEQTIVSIGKSTARRLHALGIKEVIISCHPSEESMVQAIIIVSDLIDTSY